MTLLYVLKKFDLKILTNFYFLIPINIGLLFKYMFFYFVIP